MTPSHLAGMSEDGRAVALDVLVEPDAGASLGQHARKRGLADVKRIAPQVVPKYHDHIRLQADQLKSKAYRNTLSLARWCRQRPKRRRYGRRAAEQRDEVATPCMSGKQHSEGRRGSVMTVSPSRLEARRRFGSQ
jgi:hypothetical protein